WSGDDGYGNPTQGRVTKGAAEMALADLYLWRSSFMGKNEWQLASDWADSVIASGLWSLNDDYIKTFLPSNKGNAEEILVITNSGAVDRTSNIFQLFYYPRDWGLGDVDVPLYRYAEALLIYAEAQNELGNTGVAVQYLNMIRARARKGTGAQARTEPHDYGTAGEAMDKLSVRDAIFMERAWEFAF